MQILMNMLERYFTFHYGLGCAICLIIFCGYLYFIRRKKKSQGQSVSKKDILCGLVLSIYLVIIFGGTVLNREVGEEYLIEWIPFWSYHKVWTEEDVSLAWQIVCNILVFIPWGILMPEIFPAMRKGRLIAISATGLSFLIEMIQLVFMLGLFEFDDIFHNMLGAIIGYGVWRGIVKWKCFNPISNSE